MKFYDILQQDPGVIKGLIKKSDDKKEKRILRVGMVLRSILIVVFAILFIGPLSYLFGNENSSMAVALFCILLSVRFVDFGYCIKDSLLNLTVVFLLLLISPSVAYYVHPLLGLVIHFVSFFAILIITCDRPEMGNGGLFSFAYIFLSGNPVSGEIFYKRFLLMCVGLVICGTIFFVKHRNKHTDVRFKSKLKEFSLYNHKHQWQIRMSLGVSLILTLGVLLNIKRFMWAGFACGSLLSDHKEDPKIKERFAHRLIGVVAGSSLFYVVYSLIPESLHMIIGPLGGFCLGFCSDYRFKTAVNCFGALMLAAGIYGVKDAVLIRIGDNLIGIAFAFIFYYVYDKFVYKKFKAQEE